MRYKRFPSPCTKARLIHSWLERNGVARRRNIDRITSVDNYEPGQWETMAEVVRLMRAQRYNDVVCLLEQSNPDKEHRPKPYRLGVLHCAALVKEMLAAEQALEDCGVVAAQCRESPRETVAFLCRGTEYNLAIDERKAKKDKATAQARSEELGDLIERLDEVIVRMLGPDANLYYNIPVPDEQE